MSAAIEAHELRKTYPPAIKALDGLSLSVETGAIFALLGPNGAGKSTAVRVLCTLTQPDSGTARVAGIDVLARPMHVRHEIGVIGQKHGSDPSATGFENLALQGAFYEVTGRVLKERIALALARFGLTEIAHRPVRSYSGGMRRRLDIAMGMLHHPRVLFLDEPTTGLDPEGRVGLWAEIKRLANEDLMTILLTTHYLDEADRLASRLAIIDRGRVIVEGTPEELKRGLDGDTIQIELDQAEGDGETARAALAYLETVHDVALDGRILRARSENASVAIPGVLAALEASGVTATSVTLARPSLDEVYMRHAGRAYTHTEYPREEVAS